MEEEDLELLRMAALKTLHKQKSAPTAFNSQIQHVSTSQKHLNVSAPSFIPVTNQSKPPWDPYAPPAVYIPPVIQQLAYIPTVTPPVSISTVPVMPNIPTNVQLSPRSAAFVSMNNDILLRRQHEKSPPGYRSPYRDSPPSKWSPSPPRRRRSVSRSPSPRKNLLRKRSRSKTPPSLRFRERSLSPRSYRRDRLSPKKNGKWTRSNNNSPNRRPNRTPPKDRSRSPVSRRSSSRSPGKRLNRNYNNRPRRRSPQLTSRYGQNNTRPYNIRENDRKERDRIEDKTEKSGSRKSPSPKRLKSKTKSPSPAKSRSLSPGADLAAFLEKLDADFEIFPSTNDELGLHENIETDIKEKESMTPPIPEIGSNTPPISKSTCNLTAAEKKNSSDLDIEDELLKLSDDEISLGGNDVELDDLFATDDSESENEGRFKSGSTKTERKPAAVVPFSKLGSSSTTVISGLSSTTEKSTRDRFGDIRKNRDDRRDRRKLERNSPIKNNLGTNTRPDQRRIEWNTVNNNSNTNRKIKEKKNETVTRKFRAVIENKRSNTPGKISRILKLKIFL